MQIKKLEDELGIVIFDRSKQPVMATETGREIIEQARKILTESKKIREIIEAENKEVQGKIKLGIIPTLAPYILPLFLKKFLKNYPKVTLVVEEIITEHIVDRLNKQELDCGILVTPLPMQNLRNTPLFYEPFVVYSHKLSAIAKKRTVTLDDIDLKEMWILNDGHCMKSQVQNMCFGSAKGNSENNFEYQSGSVETLIKLVENNGGFTILPELSILDFSAKQINMVRYFRNPEPAREVSLIYPKDMIRKKIIDVLKEELTNCVPEKMKHKNQKEVVKI
ncbi:MAG: hydrogen peroxide-inducible genes activator [Cytophagaceae bacterium]|nr:hydrogen peroxide-inducible genes activator [Cytophagaceae bacterium]